MSRRKTQLAESMPAAQPKAAESKRAKMRRDVAADRVTEVMMSDNQSNQAANAPLEGQLDKRGLTTETPMEARLEGLRKWAQEIEADLHRAFAYASRNNPSDSHAVFESIFEGLREFEEVLQSVQHELPFEDINDTISTIADEIHAMINVRPEEKDQSVRQFCEVVETLVPMAMSRFREKQQRAKDKKTKKDPRLEKSRSYRERTKIIEEIRGLVASDLGREERRQRIREIIDDCGKFSSLKAYQKMWGQHAKKAESAHEFMTDKRDVHPAILYLENHYTKKLSRPRQDELSFFVIGPGAGVDDGYLYMNHPTAAGFYGMDGAKEAVEETTRTLKEISENDEVVEAGQKPIIDYRQGDFQVGLPALAEEIMNSPTGTTDWIQSPITDVISISTLHYFWADEFVARLKNIRRMLEPTGGRLTIALKTPESSTAAEHDRFSYEEGYHIGLDPREGIMRVFMQKDTIKSKLHTAGFTILDEHFATVEGYDRYGKEEQFRVVIATPRTHFVEARRRKFAR